MLYLHDGLGLLLAAAEKSTDSILCDVVTFLGAHCHRISGCLVERERDRSRCGIGVGEIEICVRWWRRPERWM